MVRIAILSAVAFTLTACGPAQESAEIEATESQTATVELGCSAYQQSQYIVPGNWIVCGTRPFAESTTFIFTNNSGSNATVRLQSGPDLVYKTFSPGATWWWHQYYGGYVRIEPVNGPIFVKMN
jgi:hypothetical protein